MLRVSIMKTAQRPQRFYQKKTFRWSMGIVAGILIVLGLAFRLSPWPGALVIRSVFERGGHNTLVAMQKALPDYPVAITNDVAYGNSRDM